MIAYARDICNIYLELPSNSLPILGLNISFGKVGREAVDLALCVSPSVVCVCHTCTVDTFKILVARAGVDVGQVLLTLSIRICVISCQSL